MDSDRSSPLGQDVDVSVPVHASIGDEEIPAANHDIDSATTNGHADPSLKKTSEDLNLDGIKIEFYSEGTEERLEERSVAHTVQTDGGDGLRDVPVNHDKLNVGFFPSPTVV